MKHVMVTGATEQLGRMIIGDLLAENYRVTAVLPKEDLSILRSLGDEEQLNLLTCNLADPDETSKLFEPIDAINVLVHIDNVTSTVPDDYETCTKQVDVSINLISHLGNKIDHAVIGSSTSVYGNTVDEKVSEDYPVMPITYHGSCLLASEKFWNLFNMNSGKPVAILRFAQNEAGLANMSQSVLSAVGEGNSGIINIY